MSCETPASENARYIHAGVIAAMDMGRIALCLRPNSQDPHQPMFKVELPGSKTVWCRFSSPLDNQVFRPSLYLRQYTIDAIAWQITSAIESMEETYPIMQQAILDVLEASLEELDAYLSNV